MGKFFTNTFTFSSALTVAVLLAAVLGGCSADPNSGYSFAARFDQDIRTIAVPLFTLGSNEYRRGLEAPITEALIKRIELDCPYKVVDRSRADTILTGKLISVNQKVLNYHPDAKVPRQTELTITASYKWKDLRSGKIISEDKTITACGVYTNISGETAVTGYRSAIDKLAEMIVNDMELPW